MRKLITLLMISACLFATAANKTLNIYKLANRPVVDGNTSDWGTDWIDIAQIKPGNVTSDCTAKFQIGYTNDSLYVVLQINDATPNNSTTISGTYRRDCAEIFVKMDTTTKSITAGSTQYRLQRDNSVLERNQVLVNAVSKDLGTTYIQEWALPWVDLAAKEAFPLDMTSLNYVRFEIQVADNTTGTNTRTEQLFWNAGTDTQFSSMSDLGFLKLMGAKTANKEVLDTKSKVIYNSTKDAIFVSDYTGEISIFDTNGKKILNTRINNSTEGIRLSTLNKGVYLVKGTGFSSKFAK